MNSIPSPDNAGPDTRPRGNYCAICGERSASVSSYNEACQPRCFDCGERLAEKDLEEGKYEGKAA